MNNDSPNILAQVIAKDALRADLAAASLDHEQAMEREHAASQLGARLHAQLNTIRSLRGDAEDQAAAEERADFLAIALGNAQDAEEIAAAECAAIRLRIKEGMEIIHTPITITKDSVKEHLEAIAAGAAEVERIDSAIRRHEQDNAARHAARAAEGQRHQEEFSRFLAGKALGEIPEDATFEPPVTALDDATLAADRATLAGLATRRAAALANLEQLRTALPAIRAATLITELESVLREYSGAAIKEQRLRLRANALRAMLDPYEVRKPGFVAAPPEQPASTGVDQERERLLGILPDLWATA